MRKPGYIFLLVLSITSCRKEKEVQYVGYHTLYASTSVYLERHDRGALVSTPEAVQFFAYAKEGNGSIWNYSDGMRRIRYHAGLNQAQEKEVKLQIPGSKVTGPAFWLGDHKSVATTRKIQPAEDMSGLVYFNQSGEMIRHTDLPFLSSGAGLLAAQVSDEGTPVLLMKDEKQRKIFLIHCNTDGTLKYVLTPAPLTHDFNDDIAGVIAEKNSFYLLINFNVGSARYFKVTEYRFDGESRMVYAHHTANKSGLDMLSSDDGLNIVFRGIGDRETGVVKLRNGLKSISYERIPDELLTNSFEHLFFGNNLSELEYMYKRVVSNFILKEDTYYFTLKVFDKNKFSSDQENHRFAKQKLARVNQSFDPGSLLLTTFDDKALNNFFAYSYLATAGKHFVHISSPVDGGRQLNFIKIDRDGKVVK